MSLLNAPLDLAQLEHDDLLQGFVAHRDSTGMITMRPRNAGLKILFSSGLSALHQPSGELGVVSGSAHSFMSVIGAGVGGEDDDGVLEIDLAAFAVFHLALVEHLEEQLQHVGVRLLHFVEQHHGIRPPPHRFGEHAAFAVAHISRRRSLQRGNGVRLLELRHVDGDQVVLAAVEQVGERQRRLGLADAARPHQHEHADRLVGIVEPSARRADALADHLQRVRPGR